MNIVFLLTNQIIIFFIMMACGFCLVKFNRLKSSDSKILSIISVYIIIPCVIINAFQIDYSDEIRDGFILAVIAAILIHVILFVLMYIFQKIMKLKFNFIFKEVETASIIYSNAGNLIIPLVMSILGHEWVIFSSAFLGVQTVIIWTHGLSLIQGEKNFNIKKILLNINVICVIIGLILFFTGVKPPVIISQTMSALAGLIGPVSLIMLGMLLAGIKFGNFLYSPRVYFIIFLKMLVFPLFTLLFLKYSGLAGFAANGKIILLISLMAVITPSATTVTQMAQIYDKNAAYAGVINALTTAACIVTMPVLTAIYLY